MKKTAILSLCSLFSVAGWPAIIDKDVLASVHTIKSRAMQKVVRTRISVLVFFNTTKDVPRYIADIKKSPNIQLQTFDSLPVVLASLPADAKLLQKLASHPTARQISSYHGGKEELEISAQAILLTPSVLYPSMSNWWDNGYRGLNSVVGIIDAGIDTEHPSLSQKNLVTRTEKGSGFDDFKNGVRAAHATGIACIYAGVGSSVFPKDIGIAGGVHSIVSGLAGTETGDEMDKLAQTFSTLDWMLNRAPVQPDVINYSFGNGPTNCSDCSDWSGIAKVVDYVVQQKHILWVKSAGNGGYIEASSRVPFSSTMTIPADNYNALTVANINPVLVKDGQIQLNPDRNNHAIHYTSSRGPTLNGRKKPDISAPGNDTRTCAPDPSSYPFSYTKEMDYHDGYRLMGGTSSAAPHVGAAALLLHDAGITTPMAKKALLINSADAYTDSDKPGPDDPKHSYTGGHYPVMGSEWNRTYGWGYLNMQSAFDERHNLIEDSLTLASPEKIYVIDLPVGGKITLVHEHRVGYTNGHEWRLSPLRLELLDFDSHKPITHDDSAIDTVHQVANCIRKTGEKDCSADTKPIHAYVKVTLLSPYIDGGDKEPFALAFSGSLH